MAKIDSKNLVLHGIGTAVLLDQNGKASATLMKMQNMKIEITSESQDVFGGDSLFPIFNFITSKNATFSFTNAVVDMNVLAATQGSEVSDGGEAIGFDEIVVAATNKLSVNAGIEVDSVEAILDGRSLKRVTGSPNEGEFAVTATGSLTFHSTVTNGTKVSLSYVYKTTDGSTVAIKTTDVPGYVELRHVSNPVDLPDGRTVQVHTRVYRARCEGGFNLEYTRDGAVAPEVSFKSVDPERADKRFVSYSLVELKK